MSILKKRSCMLTCNKSFISSLLFYYLVYPLLLKVCGSVFPKEIVVKYDNSFIFSGTTFYGWLIVFVLLASPQLTNLWLKLPKSDDFRPSNLLFWSSFLSGLHLETFPLWKTLCGFKTVGGDAIFNHYAYIQRICLNFLPIFTS